MSSQWWSTEVSRRRRRKRKKFKYDARDRLMTARVHRSKWSRQGSWMIRYCSCTRPTTIERRRLDGRQWRGNGELDEFSRGCARQPATAHGVATVTKSSWKTATSLLYWVCVSSCGRIRGGRKLDYGWIPCAGHTRYRQNKDSWDCYSCDDGEKCYSWICCRYGQQTVALKPMEKHLRVIKDDQRSRLIRAWIEQSESDQAI